jgi:uncharacterized protein
LAAIVPTLCVLVLALFTGASGRGVAVQGEIAPNDGWVTDPAGLLSAEQERSLESLCESYRTGSGQEIAVLLLADLGGRPIESVALETAREWKIGGKGEDDGALLVVAKAERKIRIEVGRGLEGVLTDSVSGRIIRGVIAPRFAAGDFYGGVRAGLEAIHGVLGGEYGAVPQEPGERRESIGGLLFAIVFLIVLFGVHAARKRRRRRGWGGVGPFGGPMLGGPFVGGPFVGGRGIGGGFGGGGFRVGGGGFGGFGGGGGFRGGGATGGW